jgi:hypothetical protein
MQIVKKIFNSFVAFVTILSSVASGVLALPSVASAATISSGDLIKASTPAVYYYGADGKRYVFPNEKTYYTWYSDFSSVKTITDAELAAVQIGGNVTYKPGVKMVKITTDPKVYAVGANGTLRWVTSEAVAIALYGTNWNKMIDDVADSFFVNYTVGAAINSASEFSPAAVTAAATSINVDKNLGSGTGPVASGSVTAMVASDTPAGTTLPKNANAVMFAKFEIRAGSSADAVVTGLKVRRQGSGLVGDFSNVYLYDANGTRLTTGRTINSSTHLVEFNGLNVTVPAGQPKAFVVWGDLSGSAATVGGRHAFELSDAASVVLSGTGTVSGNFPLRANEFTIGSASVGRLDVQKGVTPSNPNVGAKQVEISNFKLVANTNDMEVRRITLTQSGTVSNSDITNLNLYQGSTLVASAAAMTGDKVVLTFTPALTIPNGVTRTFSLKADIAGRSGRTIKTYVEYTTDVYGVDKIHNAGAAVCIASTAVGGCSSTGQGSFDGSGSNYVEITTQGGQLTVVFNGPSTANLAKGTQDVKLFNFAMTSQENELEIRNFNFEVESPNSARVRGSSSTDYFRDLKVINVDTGATVMGPTSLPTSLSSNSDSGQITLSDPFVIKPGQTLNLAITADLSNTEDDDNDFFTNGTSTYRVVFGDGTNLFDSDDVRVVSTGEYLATTKVVPNSNITGNTMTVKGSNLSISLAGSPSTGTVVKKQVDVPSVGLVFTAGAQSDITVSSLTLTGNATTTGAYAGGAYSASLLDDVVSSCRIVDPATGTQYGDSKSPDSTAGTMAITNMNLPVKKGESKVLEVRCTLDSVIGDSTYGDKYAIGIASSSDVTAQDSEANTLSSSEVTLGTSLDTNADTSGQSVIMTVKDAGTLTIATDNLRQSTILVAGGDVWHNFAQFRATAQNEDIKIDLMRVTSTGQAAAFTAVAIAQNGAVKGSTVLPSGGEQSKDVDLTGSPLVVPKNGSLTFQVWGKLANVVASSSVNGATSNVARTGGQVALGLAGNATTGEWSTSYNDKFNVRATGLASGQRVYATSTNMTGGATGNTMVVRKTKPTLTRQALSTTTLTTGSVDLYKVNVSADAMGSLAVKKLTFDFTHTSSSSGTSPLAFSNFRIRKGSTEMSLSDVRITDKFGNDLEAATLNSSVATTTKIVVVFSSGEETISGSGTTYTLSATVAGSVVAGDSVTVALTRTSDTTLGVTGYLHDTNATSSAIFGPHIDTGSSPNAVLDSTSTFIWSDLSEVPHSADMDVGDTDRSRDWMNDYLVEDLTQSQVLSR